MIRVNPYYVAMYAVEEAKRRNFDPMDILDPFTRRMRDVSTYAEDLAMDIYLIQRYKIDELDGGGKARKIIRKFKRMPECQILKEVIDEICKKNKGKEVIR